MAWKRLFKNTEINGVREFIDTQNFEKIGYGTP